MNVGNVMCSGVMESVCVCVYISLMDQRMSLKIRLRFRPPVSCRASSDWQFLTDTCRRRTDSKWHNDMFIERLWIIEKLVAAAGMSQPSTENMKKKEKKNKKHGHQLPYLDIQAHTHTHIHHLHSTFTPNREKTYGNAQDKTVSQLLQDQILHEKGHSYTHMREIFFL